MLLPEPVFSTAGALVAPCWLALAVSLFIPALRPWVWRITSVVVPVILAIAYLILIRQGFSEAPGGGFGSIVQVRALFASDSALAAGWLHYLAFDLFVGTWIARTGAGETIHPLLILPCLPLTFMLGPLGLALFFAVRLMPGRGQSGRAPW